MVPENIHTPISKKGLEILGRRGVSKTQKFKAMYGAKFKFPEGWGGGVIGQIPSMGVWIFAGATQMYFIKSYLKGKFKPESHN